MEKIQAARLSRRVRAYLGKTQEEFARMMGVSKTTVQSWDSGRKRPSPRRLEQMTELAPCFTEEIAEQLRYFSWRRSRGDGTLSSRYREETRQAAHTALDIIFEKAPSAIVAEVVEYLAARAAKYSELRDQFPAAPPKKKTRAARQEAQR